MHYYYSMQTHLTYSQQRQKKACCFLGRDPLNVAATVTTAMILQMLEEMQARCCVDNERARKWRSGDGRIKRLSTSHAAPPRKKEIAATDQTNAGDATHTNDPLAFSKDRLPGALR